MKVGKILEDALRAKGILGAEEVQERALGIRERLKPRNFLSLEEIREIWGVRDTMQLPSPTGWANAMWIHGIRNALKEFDPDRSYCSFCFRNLRSALVELGYKNQVVLGKIEESASLAEQYGVRDCIFPSTSAALRASGIQRVDEPWVV